MCTGGSQPQMLSHIWQGVVVLYIDHTVEYAHSFGIRERPLCVLGAFILTGAKLLHAFLTAENLAVLRHAHRFETLFDCHCVVNEKDYKMARLMENDRSTDIVLSSLTSLRLSKLVNHALDAVNLLKSSVDVEEFLALHEVSHVFRLVHSFSLLVNSLKESIVVCLPLVSRTSKCYRQWQRKGNSIQVLIWVR